MSAPAPITRVLIADDDPLLRDIAAATLENAGFEVQTVASGDAAIAACAARLPDIALLDVEMPGGNGYQACAAIRALPNGMNVPIVMVTGHDDAASIDHAYDIGATDFVVKPINWTLIVHRIRYVLRGARTEARIHHLAYFDVLTDLPNREWLGEHLSQSLAQARHDDGGVALLSIDLDQFKRINDTLGHETGDALLRMVAQRLTGTLADVMENGPARELSVLCDEASDAAGRIQGQLTRVGGDEFVIVLTGQPTSRCAQQLAARIQSALAAPFLHAGYEFVITPSIGIALFPEHGSDAQTLLKNADGAMYEAKASGRNQYRVYTDAVNARALKRLSLEMELRRAFESSQLEVYYQPKYHAHSLQIVGAEALLRWFHPQRGQISTADFIAVAEEIGLIGDIGRWAMQQVCRDLGQWRSEGLLLPSVAVNISGRDFMRPEVLLHMSETVSQSRLSPSLFELELTEGVLMQDAEAGRRSLLALKEFGFALAVDDFGTGYCSLSYLKRFPLDTLKIDRSFVKDMTTDADDAAIVRAIIALGHNLGLGIVAEGVSTPAQLEFLRAEGCDTVQGFLMSPAVPASTFANLMRQSPPAIEPTHAMPPQHPIALSAG